MFFFGFDLFILTMFADGLTGATGFFAAGLDVAVPVIFAFFCSYIGIAYFPFFFDLPATDKAMATACLRFFTTAAFLGPFGSFPLCRVPRLNSPIIFSTLFLGISHPQFRFRFRGKRPVER